MTVEQLENIKRIFDKDKFINDNIEVLPPENPPLETVEEIEDYPMPVLDEFLLVKSSEETEEKVSLFWKLVWWWHKTQFEAEEQATKIRQEKQAIKEAEQKEKNRIRSVIQNYMTTFNDERYNSHLEQNAWGTRIRNKHYGYSRKFGK
jgi:hypothetical protein